MKIESITIENLLSFEKSTFEFKDYNVIVGPNNSGKTNLFRILEMIKSSSLNDFIISRKIKFDSEKKTRIEFTIKISDDEIRFMLMSIIGEYIEAGKFNDEIKHITIILNWNDLDRDATIPENVILHFGNDMAIIVEHNECIMLNDHNSNNQYKETREYLNSFKNKDYQQIKYDIQHNTKAYSREDKDEINNAIISGKNIKNEYITDTKCHYISKNTFSDPDQFNKFKSEVTKYVNQKINADNPIGLGGMIYHIINNNFVLVKEIQPTYEILKNDLFALKMKSDKAYDILRKTFKEIFLNAEMRVEEDVKNGSGKNIWIVEREKPYRIEDAASGHFAALHILNNILNKENQILFLDEPELHFHPIKISHIGQKLSELADKNNNQIIIITHSPKFVNFRLLKSEESGIIAISKKDKESKALSSNKSNSTLKPQLFNPEVFFVNTNFLVEGPSDEQVIKAISDFLGGLFDKYSIMVIDCNGRGNIDSHVKFLKSFSLSYYGMADKKYDGVDSNITKHDNDLETELKKIEWGEELQNQYKKIGWSKETKKLRAEIAYDFMTDLLNTEKGFEELQKTTIWSSIDKLLRGQNINEGFEKYIKKN